MYLIKKSTVVDKNIKFKHYASVNTYFDEKVKFNEKPKTKLSNFRETSNLTKISKLRKMSNFKYILQLPHLLPSFGFGKPKGNRLYFGIVTVVIWTLS